MANCPPLPVRRLGRTGAVAAAVLSCALLPAAGSARAQDGALSLTTPFPAVEAQPGTTVKLDVTVSSAVPEPVHLDLADLPDAWTATLRGGGFVIHDITSADDGSATAQLEIDVPSDAVAGDYPLEVVGTGSAGDRASLGVVLTIADEVDNGVTLTTDFPTLSGDPGGSFDYTLTVDNSTPVEQTFTFDPTGPQGWTVTASPAAEAKAQTLTVDAGGTGSLKVSATAPETAEQGDYPIDVTVTGANGATGAVRLQAEVVGTPELTLGTADQRLDVSGKADHVQRVPLVIANSGTAPLEAVKLAGTAPTDWDVTFDPKEVDAVQPGETVQVTAIVTPATDAVAGDYSMTVRASSGSLSSNVDLRYSPSGSRTLGIVAIGVIAAAFLVLAGVFVKFGRR